MRMRKQTFAPLETAPEAVNANVGAANAVKAAAAAADAGAIVATVVHAVADMH